MKLPGAMIVAVGSKNSGHLAQQRVDTRFPRQCDVSFTRGSTSSTSAIGYGNPSLR